MDLEKLIYIILNKTPLWDMREKTYNNRDVQRKLWVKVAEEMDAEVGAVKKKWQNLRDVFRKEYNKTIGQNSGDETALESTSTWRYFESMLFLKDVMKPRQLQGNISPPKNHESEDDDLNVTPKNYSYIKKESDQLQSTINNSQSLLNNSLATSTEINQINSIKKKNRKLNKFNEEFLKMEKEKLKLFGEQEDSDYQFLVSLLPYLKTVPFHRKLTIRQKLQQVFLEEEEMRARSYSSTPSPMSTYN